MRYGIRHALATYGHLFPDRLDEVADAMDAHRIKVTAQTSRTSREPVAPNHVH
ncbi:MAG: hypothetical protein M0026_22190 [Nocardiopsaceae bacterium]|nr:hypothetical protein [Nocardiopsaceae bacterium]